MILEKVLFLPLQIVLTVVTQGNENILRNILINSTNVIMHPFNIVSDTKTFRLHYDFIIIGGGSAGCVLANRLTQVSEWNVLLLEAGDEEVIMTDVPLAAPLLTTTEFNWGYQTDVQDNGCTGMDSRRCHWPRGKALGGSSVINYMMYTRGHGKNFDEWAALGNKGWSGEEVLPYFKKSEKLGIKELRSSPYHSAEGELPVTYSTWRTPFAKSHLEAANEVGIETRDLNGEHQLGISYVQVNIKNGRRQSAAKTFIRPVRNRPNLFVSKNSCVTKIVVDPLTKQAKGVQFAKNRKSYYVEATKEVILSAGTINSPQILMLSGIGERKHLSEMNISVIHHLPGVGENLQDHPTFNTMVFLINQSISLVDLRVSTNLEYSIDYLFRSTGPLTCPGGAEVLAFVNTRQSRNDHPELDDDIPDMEFVFSAGSLAGDTFGGLRRSLGIGKAVVDEVIRPIIGKDGFQIVPILLKPKSRGRIRLQSSNPFHWPRMYHNYYTHPADIQTMLRGIKLALRIADAKAYRKYNSTLHSIKYPGCQQHEHGSDQYWLCAARLLSNNLHHQVGTCKMAPVSDPMGVVDPQLKVHGISKLRVVDASIMPTIPSAHTNAATYMIAEKAADMIKAEWQLVSNNVRHLPIYGLCQMNNKSEEEKEFDNYVPELI